MHDLQHSLSPALATTLPLHTYLLPTLLLVTTENLGIYIYYTQNNVYRINIQCFFLTNYLYIDSQTFKDNL